MRRRRLTADFFWGVGVMGDIDSARNANAGVGATLRAYRLRSGRDLTDAAETLHIRKPFLQAIEDGRYEDLPGPTYASGFVRAYADYLELDADEAVRRFKLETLGRRIGGDLHFPAPESERGVPKGAILLISALLAALAYGGWYFLSSSNTNVSELVASLPERLSPDSATLSAPLSATPPEPAPPPPTAPSSPEPMATPAPPPALAPPANEAATADSFAPPPPPVEPAAATTARPSSQQPPVQPPNNDERIVLNAKADSWIELRGRDQRVVLSQILKAGETLSVENGGGLTLMTGNAGGLEIVLDGTPLPPLGRDGGVRRGIVLESAALKRMRDGGD